MIMSRSYDKTLEITALYEISKLLGSSLNLKSNLRGVMRVLAEYLDMKRGTVALRSDSEVSIIAAHGMSEEEIKRGRYKLGEGIIGRVAKHGSPIVIPNIGDEPLFLNKTGSRKTIKKENVAFLCVPIKFKNEILGVLSVDRLFGSKAVSFEEDLRLLKIIASLIAQYVRMHMEIEKEREAFLEEKENLKSQLKGKYRVENIIGQSDSMQEVFEAVHRVAPSKANVLLRGESGTGKELVAKAIHYMSARAKGPFIKFNCASIPEGLLESELFGHEKGSFTGATAMRKGRFELANGGSIFLDEIGDLPLTLQPKILRVLQEKEFRPVGSKKTVKIDIRFIAATNRDLSEMVKEGKFREDFFYRLNVFPIDIPPLRYRKEDIPALAYHFLHKYSKEVGRDVPHISAEAMRQLIANDWPGNVRELENVIHRAVIVCEGRMLKPEHIIIPLNREEEIEIPKTLDELKLKKKDLRTRSIEDIEKSFLIAALKRNDWNITKAAAEVGMQRTNFHGLLKKYNISKGKVD